MQSDPKQSGLRQPLLSSELFPLFSLAHTQFRKRGALPVSQPSTEGGLERLYMAPGKVTYALPGWKKEEKSNAQGN